MTHMDMLRDRIVSNYDKMYFNYALTLTFRPNTVYVNATPRIASAIVFKEIYRYTKRRGISFILFPEISDKGVFHYHGMLSHSSDKYETHMKTFRVFLNWLRRKYGFILANRIYTLTGTYTENRCGLLGQPIRTSFKNVWRYLTKQYGVYKYLKAIMSDDFKELNLMVLTEIATI